MPWAEGILLFTMAVTMLSSFLRADPEAFSEIGATSGVVSETAIHFGKLLIGGQGTVSDGETKTSDLMSTESDEYESNEEARFRLAKAKLRSLGPSVHCSNDSMTLRIPGPRTPHFLVDRGEESPVPLSMMPASCGFSLKRARRDVSLVAPYQGCHVRQQGGSYILPLLIMGAPVQMSCLMSPRLPAVSCFPSGMIISLGVRADVKIKVDGSWQPLLLTYSKCSFTLDTTGGSLVVTAPFTGSCWEVKDTERHLPLMYGDREVTLSCPLTPPTPAPGTTAPAAAPTLPLPAGVYDQHMFYPFPIGRPWWPYPPGPPATPPPPTVPTTTTTTTSTTTTTTPPPLQDPVPHPMFPHMHPMFNPYYFYPNAAPAAPVAQAAPAVPAAPVAPAVPAAPLQPYPWYQMFPPYVYGFQSPAETTTAATTTPPTTTTAAQSEQHAEYPMFPMFYGQQPIKSYPPPAVNYPFMPQYPQHPVFGPRSPKSAAPLSSIYRSRRHHQL
ncbi:hypothetical protein Q8A67_021504 [Cirrhinus molitorella]|uniref:Zona pellucida sperm-binding protein 1/4 Ig-like domain-containing protein n=1 Tax=Cirrhinus molitorella TaxID=172907 RepID=A0AA88PHP1_9TELE|nr:hypothetical protein Q8A67_021504 [Cirrhinus molitorella]